MVDHYHFLGLPEHSTHEEIELAFEQFKKELMKFSPGVQISPDELRLRRPKEWDAYKVLLNPELRKEHDERLERDRIHASYEAQNKATPESEPKSRWNSKYIGAGVIIVAIGVYVLNLVLTTQGRTIHPNWRTHFITDEIKVLLPAAPDTNINILPPFMMHYIKNKSCYRSELPDGFSVTVAKFETIERFKISFKDVSYIVNNDMGSHLAIQYPDSTTFTMSIHDYRAFIRKGNYGYEGSLHAYENYSLVKDNSAIKVIVSYIPGNETHKRYSEIIFNSLLN